MDITSLPSRPQSTPPPTISDQSDWYPPPTTLHIVEEEQTASQSSTASHRHPPTSLPPSSFHAASPHHTHYTIPRHHSARSTISPEAQYDSQPRQHPNSHPRSTTSPEAHYSSLPRPHPNRGQSLQRGYSMDTLQNGHYNSSRNGQPFPPQDGRPHTISRTTSSHTIMKYPYTVSNGPPPLPPKGTDTQASYTRQQNSWDGSDVRGQSSQPNESRGFDPQAMDYKYPYDTMSEHSLSDSTQTSDVSEPTYRRPKPRQHPRPTSAPRKNGPYHHQYQNVSLGQGRTNGSLLQDDMKAVGEPQTQSFTAISSYPHAQPHHPTHHKVAAGGIGHDQWKDQWRRHSLSGHSSTRSSSQSSVHNSTNGSTHSSTHSSAPSSTHHHEAQNRRGDLRKGRNMQHSGTGISDYATHSRKILAVVDQQGQHSQMAEHVTLAPQSGSPLRERMRHQYEEIEVAENHNTGGSGRHADIVASVKRSNRWSPGLPKHLKDRVAKNEQSRAKRATRDDRSTGKGNAFNIMGRRNSTPATSGTRVPVGGAQNADTVSLQHWKDGTRTPDMVSLVESEAEWSSQTTATLFRLVRTHSMSLH